MWMSELLIVVARMFVTAGYKIKNKIQPRST